MRQILLSLKAAALLLLLDSTGAFAQFSLSEKESQAVVQSSASRDLITVQNEFLGYINKAIGRGTSLETIRKAAVTGIQRNNSSSFYELVFGDSQAGQNFMDRLVLVKRRFLDQNKYIEANRDLFNCITCKKPILEEANWFFDNYQGLSQARAALISLEAEGSGAVIVPCGSYWNQLKLLACTALCSATTAGLAAVLCGWGCWCSFCSTNSALASLICEN